MSIYDVWVHGTSVQIEFPEKTKLARKGTGTIVSQDVTGRLKTDYNWFHFPIPTPTTIDDFPVTYNDAWLHYSGLTTKDKTAKITEVRVYDMAYPTDNCTDCKDGLIYATDPNWTADPAREKESDFVQFNLPDVQAFEGAVLSVKVDFSRPSGSIPSGSITFLGAGMRFYRTKYAGSVIGYF